MALVLAIAAFSASSAANADIPDDKVEDIALELKLVSPDEAEYPSIAEMEERVQSYNAGEAFTAVSVRLGIFLVAAIVIITLGLSGFKLAQNKDRLKRFAIPAVGLIAVLLISRISASTSTEGLITAAEFTEGELTLVSTLVNATLILLVISFTALLSYRIKHVITK